MPPPSAPTWKSPPASPGPPPAALAVPGAYLAITAFAATAAVLAAALNGVRRAARPAVEELRDL
jgi:putative ABC transport system permease protein